MDCYQFFDRAVCAHIATWVLLGGALAALFWFWRAYMNLFDRQTKWKRRYRTSAYYADRHGEVRRRREPLDKDEVRRRAKRRL